MAEQTTLDPVPGAPPAEFSLQNEDLHICGHCFELRYPRALADEDDSEWCRCDRESQQRRPPTYGDLRSRRRLCWSCATTLANGASRWTLHVCQPCSADIQRINRVEQRVVAPIGVHSLMHGIGTKVEGLPLPPGVAEALTIEFNSLFAGIHRACTHRRFLTAELCRRFGLYGQAAIPVSEYLAAAREHQVPRDEGVVSLITFIQDPLVWPAQNPEHRPIEWGNR